MYVSVRPGQAVAIFTLMAWYRKTPCMASLTASMPLKEKDRLERPPLTLALGKVS